MSVAGFLNELLQNSWQLHLREYEHHTMLSCSHSKLGKIAEHCANELCCIIAYFEECDEQQIIEQVFDLAKNNLQRTLTRFPENWFLFDIKGNPICAVPNKELGAAFSEEMKQKHGVILQCFNAFERFVPKSFKEWERLNRVKDNRLFFRIKIAFYKTQKQFLP